MKTGEQRYLSLPFDRWYANLPSNLPRIGEASLDEFSANPKILQASPFCSPKVLEAKENSVFGTKRYEILGRKPRDPPTSVPEIIWSEEKVNLYNLEPLYDLRNPRSENKNFKSVNLAFNANPNVTRLNLSSYAHLSNLEVLKIVLNCGRLVELDLSNHSFSGDNLKVLGDKLDGVEGLSLANTRGFSPQELCEFLKKMPLLKRLNVSFCAGFSALCLRFTHLNLLTHLDISNTPLESPDLFRVFLACKRFHFEELFIEGLESFTTARVVSHILSESPQLRKLSLAYSSVTEPMPNFLHPISKLPELTFLNLSQFTGSLSNLPRTLKTLVMRNTDLPFDTLASLLTPCQSLQELDLSKNPTLEEASLRGLLFVLSNLKVLRLNHTPKLSESILKSIRAEYPVNIIREAQRKADPKDCGLRVRLPLETHDWGLLNMKKKK